MITKTNYLTFRACPRAYFYTLNNKDQATKPSAATQKSFDDGYKVNEFAYQLFSNVAKVKKDNKATNPKLQEEITKKLLSSNTCCIAEASFIYEDLFCAVDILNKNGDAYDIYEVKASCEIGNKMEKYGPDVAFQKYVLQKCGLTIKNCYIVHLNKNFVKNGKINAKDLFIVDCINNDPNFIREFDLIDKTLEQMRQLQKSKDLPNYGDCNEDCQFFAFCHKGLPEPNLLEFYRFGLKKAHDLFNQGIKSFDDVAKANTKLTKFQQVQLKTYLNKENNFNKDAIVDFLNSLKYPIYHLDFETMQEPIPLVDGTRPYQQVPFQYSLHIEYKDGKVDHKEFLGEKLNCQYELAKQLVKDIKLDGMPMAYNVSFEKDRLEELAETFKDLELPLMAIREQIVDLIIPFRSGDFYSPDQHGSNSIKDVMPAIVPEMAKDYKQLPVVHNGGEASALFPELVTKLKGKEYEDKRSGLLKYCELDTKSMVKILEKLRILVK